jgi:hypothetical protein
MKKFLSILLIVALLCSFASVGSYANSSLPLESKESTEIEKGDAYFSSEYASVGVPLKAFIKGKETEKFLYKWYINDELIDNTVSSYTPQKCDLESTVKVMIYDFTGNFAGEKSMLISELPVIYIETENHKEVLTKEIEVKAQMKVQGNAAYNDLSELYDGGITIKCRGNSTLAADKKPYKIKLDSSTNLFGMGKSKHWVLLSNPYDETLMKNTLAYNFAGDLGLEYEKSVWIDVVLNGENVGNYQLCEHVRIGDTRVNITDWDEIAEDAAKKIYKANSKTLTKDDYDELETLMEDDLSWTTSDVVTYKSVTYKVSDYYSIPEINGGYLFEIDRYDDPLRFYTSRGTGITVSKPEGISSDMMNSLKSYYQAFENALYSDDFCTEHNGKTLRYNDFIDVESFAKGFVANELFANLDYGVNSFYMYKNVDGKICYGPVWDMDMSCGCSAASPGKWRFTVADSIIRRMMSDPLFINEVCKQYWKYRYTAINDLIKDNGDIFAADSTIHSSAIFNQYRWDVESDYDESVDFLKSWLENRVMWMDEQLKDAQTAYNSMEFTNSDLVYSSDMSLSFYNNILSVSSDNVAAQSVKIFINGELAKVVRLTKLSADVSLDANEADMINVVAYDSEGKAVAGTYLNNVIYPIKLEVNSMPLKIDYAKGEALDLNGLQLKVTYSDSSCAEVTPDAAVTYVEDCVGEQDYGYNAMPEKSGNIYAVLKYKSVSCKIKLNLEKSKDISNVEELIDKIPVNNISEKYLKEIFEAQIAYDDLNDESKALIKNYDILNNAMNYINNIANNSKSDVIGCYVDGLLKKDYKNTLVVVSKGNPEKMQIIYESGGTATYISNNSYGMSIRRVGGFCIWTINAFIKSSDNILQIRSLTAGQKENSHYSFDLASYTNQKYPINSLSYKQAVNSPDKTFSVCANVVYDVSAIRLKENGNVIAVGNDKSSRKISASVDLITSGTHKLDLEYYANSNWFKYKTLEVYVRPYSSDSQRLYGINCSENSYHDKSEVTFATSKNIENVTLNAERGNIVLTDYIDTDNYRIWNADINTGISYKITVGTTQTDKTVFVNKLTCKGDVNSDGKINSGDALLILRIAVGNITPTAEQLKLGDIDSNNSINSLDALIVLQIVTGYDSIWNYNK